MVTFTVPGYPMPGTFVQSPSLLKAHPALLIAPSSFSNITTYRQILPATGVSGGNYGTNIGATTHVDSNKNTTATTDVIMAEAPAVIPSRVQRATQYYHHNVAPMVEPAFAAAAPALTVAANGLTHGIKRAAHFSIVKPWTKVVEAYVELHQSTNDGLVVKRFKRMPIAPNKTTSLAELDNTLPVQELRQLPADQFRWTGDALSFLGARHHERVRAWLRNVLYHMKAGLYCVFPHIDDILDPHALPASVTNVLRDTGKLPYLSLFLHNHMIAFQDKDCEMPSLERFKESGFKLIEKLEHLLTVHHHTYYDRGRIPAYESLGIKPTGPIQIPYAELGSKALNERLRLKELMETVHYLLTSRDLFNQNFPVNTFAGILADLDAIRKDELPPSYVDWPGKEDLRMPGSYPEVDMEPKLFDTIKFADFSFERMWDQLHPSPGKKVKTADYRTPVRRAMKKNELFKDHKGQLQARKGALKKTETDFKSIEIRCAREIEEDADKRIDLDMDVEKEVGVAFMDSPVAWYIPSQNTPVQHGKHGKSKRVASMTPFACRKPDRTAVVQVAEVVEPVQEPLRAVDPNRSAAAPQTVRAVQIVDPTWAIHARPAGDALPVHGALPTTDHALLVASDAPSVTEDALSAVANATPVIELTLPVVENVHVDALQTVTDAPPMAETTHHTNANEVSIIESLPTTEGVFAAVSDETPVIEDAIPAARAIPTVTPLAAKDVLRKATNTRYVAMAHRETRRHKQKTLDELLDDEDGPFGKATFMKISEEKEIDIALRVQLQEDSQFRKQQDLNASVKRQLEEKLKAKEAERKAKEEERNRAEEERRRAQKELRMAEQIEDKRIAGAGRLRQPHQHIVPEVAPNWRLRAEATLSARSTVELAILPDGTPLSTKDFQTLVPANRWLNDEIVNGTLSHLNNYINQSAGIKNTRTQTPKSQLLNSFIGKQLVQGEVKERTLNRAGVKKENFLDIETLFFPICNGYHWTLVVIRPKHRQICHLDSMRPNGQNALKANALKFVRQFLGKDFHEDEWTFMDVSSPQQANSDDCGLHTITNGICMGLGIDPTGAYDTTVMEAQRLRLASVLLNGGFKEDFALDDF